MNRIALSVALVAAFAVSGCASRGYGKSEDTAHVMQAAVESTQTFGVSRQAAFDAMNQLTSEPYEGLPAKFESFSSAVDVVASSEKALRSGIGSIRPAASSRFAAWEKENATFENAGIQARSQQRLTEAQAMVEKAAAGGDSMLEQAGAFVSYLNDLRKLLSNDLTPKGVAGCADLVQNARSSNGRLHTMATPTVNDLKAAAEALSTK